MLAGRAALLFATFAITVGCNSQQKTEEMIQARLDAEKVKELTVQTTELKDEVQKLRDENRQLATQLAAVQAKPAAVAQASRPVAKKPTAGGDQPSPADLQAAKDQLTGGGSFK